MEIRIYLPVILLAVPITFSERNYNYCRMPSCDPGTHIFCEYKAPLVDTQACGDVAASQIVQVERDLILDLHNQFRREVYNGRQKNGTNGPQPAAANPKYLKWDMELEEAAHRWSIQCQNGCDKCRNLPDLHLNQLVDTLSVRSDTETYRDLSVEAIIRDWYSEVTNVNHHHLLRFDEDEAVDRNIYHYTQMVWGDTKRIGCNTIRHNSDGYKNLKLVCNYGPAGNVNGEPVYIIK